MNPDRKIALSRILLAVLSLVVSGPVELHASTFTWTKDTAGNASGSWTNAANWSGGTLPTTTSDTASFNTLDITADSTVTLDGNQNINTVILGDTDASPAANWLLNPGSFFYSTLTLGGTTPTITVNALGAGKSATINFTLAGSTAWTKNGSGTFTLAGYCSFTSGLTLSAGQINFNSSPGSTAGTYTLSGGTIDNTSYTLNAVGSGMTWSGDFIFAGTSPLTLSGSDAMGASRTLTVNGSMLNLSGVISGSGFSLTKAGSGMMCLQGNNTYTGGTIINNGTLCFKTESASAGSPLGNVPTSTTAGNIIINGGTLCLLGSSATLNAFRGISVGPASGSGGGTIDAMAGATLTYDGVIANNGGTGSLTKSGYGGLTLGGANTFSGGTTINAGTLTLDFTQSGAPTANILNGTTGGLALGGGKFVMTGKASTANAQTVQGLTVSGGGNTVTLTPGTSGSATLTMGGITRTGGLVDFANTGTYSTSAGNNSAGILSGWATYNGFSDWAAISGSTFTAPSYLGIPTSGGSSTANYYTNANTTTLTGSVVANSLKLGGGTLALGANNLTFSGTSGGLLGTAAATISGTGYIGAGSGNEFIVVTKSGATLSANAPLIGSSDSGKLTVGGAGTLSIGAANTYTGTTTVNGGTLTLASGGSLASGSSVKVNTGATLTVNSGGTINGNVEVAPSTASTTANLNNSGTIGGTLTIDAAEAPASANVNNLSQCAPGYALLKNGSSTAGVTANGILTIDTGATTLTSLGTISSPNGTGAINYNSTVNNTLTIAGGSSFGYFIPANNSVSTLTSSGTVGFDWFGYNDASGYSFSSYTTTLNGGTWNLGSIGQNNTGLHFVGTANITGGAAVSVLGNVGYSHGAWNVQNGSLTFYGPVLEGHGANGVGLSLLANNTGGGAGTLNILGGGLTVAMQSGPFSAANSLTVASGGAANLGGALTLGTTTAQTAETDTVTLSGGKLLVNGTISAAATTSGQTRSFSWTGGQLSASAITPSSGFNGSGSISSTTLTQNGGTLAPGDVGISGQTTIGGNYTISSGTLAIDLGGTTASSAFQDVLTAGKFDVVTVSGGTASLGGSLNVNLIGGFTPAGGNTFQILTATSVSGTFNNVYNNRVTVSGTSGGSLTVTYNSANVTLASYGALQSKWTVVNASAPAGSTVSFTDNSSIGAITNWIVDFGDGSAKYTNSVSAGGTLSGVSTTHVYAGGSYTAMLTVVASDGSTAQTTQAITASSNPTLDWLGNALANWNTSDHNWTNLTSGGTSTAYADGDPVIFDENGSAHPTVNLAGVTVQPASVSFSNSATTYTVQGSGKISGSASLTKNLAGTTIVLTTNDFSGGTTINGGVLLLGDGATANGVVGSSGISDNAALVLNPAGSQTINNTINGSGTVTVENSTVTLGGANGYNGGTTVSNGATAVIAADNNLGASGSALTVNNGTLQVTAGSALTLSHPMTINSGGATFNLASGLTTTQNNSGSGTATVSAGTLQLGAAGTSGSVAGNIALAGGSLAYSRTDTLTPDGSISGVSGNGSVTNLSTAAGNTNTLTFADGINYFGLFEEFFGGRAGGERLRQFHQQPFRQHCQFVRIAAAQRRLLDGDQQSECCCRHQFCAQWRNGGSERRHVWLRRDQSGHQCRHVAGQRRTTLVGNCFQCHFHNEWRQPDCFQYELRDSFREQFCQQRAAGRLSPIHRHPDRRHYPDNQ